MADLAGEERDRQPQEPVALLIGVMRGARLPRLAAGNVKNPTLLRSWGYDHPAGCAPMALCETNARATAWKGLRWHVEEPTEKWYAIAQRMVHGHPICFPPR